MSRKCYEFVNEEFISFFEALNIWAGNTAGKGDDT